MLRSFANCGRVRLLACSPTLDPCIVQSRTTRPGIADQDPLRVFLKLKFTIVSKMLNYLRALS